MRVNRLPNWYGIEGIKFEWRGQQDGFLYYKKHIFNANDIQDTLDELRFLHGYAHMFIWDNSTKTCEVVNMAE